jgi:hypothetical protein
MSDMLSLSFAKEPLAKLRRQRQGALLTPEELHVYSHRARPSSGSVRKSGGTITIERTYAALPNREGVKGRVRAINIRLLRSPETTAKTNPKC